MTFDLGILGRCNSISLYQALKLMLLLTDALVLRYLVWCARAPTESAHKMAPAGKSSILVSVQEMVEGVCRSAHEQAGRSGPGCVFCKE